MPPPPSRKDLLVRLSRAYPRQPFTDENFVSYQHALADVEPEQLEPAIDSLIRESKWMPAVAEIRERVAEQKLRLPSEAAALAQIQARMDWARQPEADRGDAPGVHPLAREALDRVGGWHSFHVSEDATVIRGQYGRLYRELRAAAIRELQVGDLAAG